MHWYLTLLVIAFVMWAVYQWPHKARAAWEKLGDLGRAAPLLLVFAIALAYVQNKNALKVDLAIWGVAKIAICAYLGYWVDRLSFRPEDRPHLFEGISKGTAWKRRSLIISAAIIAGGMIP